MPASRPPDDRSSPPWYVEAFRSVYREVYPHRDLASARVEVEGLLGWGIGGRTLDLGCGFARHTLALLERGVDAFGLDLSQELLSQAAGLPQAGRVAGRLVRGDARALPFLAASFGSIVLLFQSFGYFDEEGNARVLRECARCLRPGGQVVLDLMNPLRLREGLVPRSERRIGTRTLVEERRFAEGGRRVQKELRLSEPGGEELRWREDVRVYDRDGIGRLAAACGLRLADVRGSFTGAPYGADAERLLVRLEASGAVVRS